MADQSSISQNSGGRSLRERVRYDLMNLSARAVGSGHAATGGPENRSDSAVLSAPLRLQRTSTFPDSITGSPGFLRPGSGFSGSWPDTASTKPGESIIRPMPPYLI